MISMTMLICINRFSIIEINCFYGCSNRVTMTYVYVAVIQSDQSKSNPCLFDKIF